MFTETLRLSVLHPQGAITTELRSVGDHGVTVGRVRSTGHEVDLREAESITFLLPRKGRLDIRISERSYRLPAGLLMAFRPTERRTRSTPDAGGQFFAATLQVPMARLRQLAQAIDARTDSAFATEAVLLHQGAGPVLARSLTHLADDLFLRPLSALPERVAVAVGQMVDDQLCEMLELAMPPGPWRRILPAYHRMRQAEEIMHEHSDDPLSMIEIARTLGVSLRSLQLAFSEVHDGQSPRSVLNRIRLDKARHRLMRARNDETVTTVALDSGFFHLSRFAQAYAKAFGERPSETLASRRH